MANSFEVGDRVKIEVDNLPYAGTVITYDNLDYKVSVDGLGKVDKFEESGLTLLPGPGGGGNAWAKNRAPTSADGENGEYWFELLNYSPGIISGDFSGNANTPNAGWEFEVTEEVSLIGLRGKARNSYTGTLKFGTTSEILAEKSVDLVAGEWVSVTLDEPITLSPNTRYVVMLYGQASTLIYDSRSVLSINSKVVYKHARYTSYGTEWPGNTENSNIYSADVMLGTDPPYPINKQYYKDNGTWSEVT